MIVSATELINDSKTVAQIQRKAGASRGELLQLLQGRGFSKADSRELKRAMDAGSEVSGYAGRD